MKKRIFGSFLIIFLFSGYISAQQNITPMVVISGGEYQIGKDVEDDAVYSPEHIVNIDSFYIDIHEVTNSQYFTFCEETGHKLPEFWGIEKYRSGMDYPDCPVVGVSKYDAIAYALHYGKRLPTEAEWEVAARGGLINQKFSNGNDFSECISLDSIFIDDVRHPYNVTSGNTNGYGLYGMCCNTREWVNDNYDKNYYKVSPVDNPQGPENGRLTVVRGGGWKSGSDCKKVYLRNALRGSWVDIAIGFRCVKDITSK